MALELPGVEVIGHPAVARARARKWSKMAAEIDTPDAPDEAKAKARELRQRASAAHDWARRQEDALEAGARAGEAHHAKVTPIRKGTAEQQHGPLVRPAGGYDGYLKGTAREVAHRTYQRARPSAMRIAARGRQHFLQGASEPFGPVGSGFDLLLEAIGVSLAVILLTDLVRAPGAIVDVSSHGLGFIHRAVGVVDPITGLAPAPAAGSRPATAPAKTVAVTGGHI